MPRFSWEGTRVPGYHRVKDVIGLISSRSHGRNVYNIQDDCNILHSHRDPGVAWQHFPRSVGKEESKSECPIPVWPQQSPIQGGMRRISEQPDTEWWNDVEVRLSNPLSSSFLEMVQPKQPHAAWKKDTKLLREEPMRT